MPPVNSQQTARPFIEPHIGIVRVFLQMFVFLPVPFCSLSVHHLSPYILGHIFPRKGINRRPQFQPSLYSSLKPYGLFFRQAIPPKKKQKKSLFFVFPKKAIIFVL
jgi:hypothetical protein